METLSINNAPYKVSEVELNAVKLAMAKHYNLALTSENAFDRTSEDCGVSSL